MSSSLAGNVQWINRFLIQWLERFPEGKTLHRINGVANCAIWHAGHIANNRRAVAKLVEASLDRPDWLEFFVPGASGDPSPSWPALGTIIDDLASTASALCQRLESVDREYMSESVPHILSDGQVPRGENVLFLLYHEGFHAGQIEQARRLAS